jgi:hypothetical protein
MYPLTLYSRVVSLRTKFSVKKSTFFSHSIFKSAVLSLSVFLWGGGVSHGAVFFAAVSRYTEHLSWQHYGVSKTRACEMRRIIILRVLY